MGRAARQSDGADWNDKQGRHLLPGAWAKTGRDRTTDGLGSNRVGPGVAGCRMGSGLALGSDRVGQVGPMTEGQGAHTARRAASQNATQDWTQVGRSIILLRQGCS